MPQGNMTKVSLTLCLLQLLFHFFFLQLSSTFHFFSMLKKLFNVLVLFGFLYFFLTLFPFFSSLLFSLFLQLAHFYLFKLLAPLFSFLFLSLALSLQITQYSSFSWVFLSFQLSTISSFSFSTCLCHSFFYYPLSTSFSLPSAPAS